uniref:Transmembrane protein n=1 Tax=Cucumis melo TaxID=3656 RepID=A0A9I9E7Z6_CUCME
MAYSLIRTYIFLFVSSLVLFLALNLPSCMVTSRNGSRHPGQSPKNPKYPWPGEFSRKGPPPPPY